MERKETASRFEREGRRGNEGKGNGFKSFSLPPLTSPRSLLLSGSVSSRLVVWLALSWMSFLPLSLGSIVLMGCDPLVCDRARGGDGKRGNKGKRGGLRWP